MKKLNYSFLSKYEQEEKEKADFQAKCSHTFWSTRCGVCSKILASDHHINIHTCRSFKKDKKLAIIIIEDTPAGDIDLYRIQELRNIKEQLGFDEITVLVSRISHLEAYTAIKYVDRVEMSSLEEELAHMRKYRKLDVIETDLVIHIETPEVEIKEKEIICKRFNTNIFIYESNKQGISVDI